MMEHGQQLRQDYGASTSSDVQQTAAAMTPMSSMLRLALRAIVHAEADEKLCSDWLAGDTEALQTWAQQYVPHYLFWVNGASLCEAAATLATMRETPVP